MNKIFFILITLFYVMTHTYAQEKPKLLFYCGVTLVKPIKEMAQIIEKKHNCTIKILQGGSKDLYDSLKFSHKGDLYLPGSDSYRINNLKDGLLLDGKYIGYNQAAIFVQKGNPKNIKSLDDLSNANNALILCDPYSGSIGRMSQKILTKYKNDDFFFRVFDNTALIGTDSRNINKALIEKKVDVAINWKASAFWPENKDFIDVIAIDDKIAPKMNLLINLLSFSQHKDIAKDFIDFAASKEGQIIMKKHGFL